MIGLRPPADQLQVHLLGAHPDDIEIGCGGTLLELNAHWSAKFSATILTGEGGRESETRAALAALCPDVTVSVGNLRDGYLPSQWEQVKTLLESDAESRRPDIVFAPRPDDAHQDHRLIGRLASTVWRDALVLHYEIPKWDGDAKSPTHYVPVSVDHARRKVDILNEHFHSQIGRDWWDDELFLGSMRMRGVECRHRYAEGFLAAKVLIDLRSGLGMGER